MLGSEFVRPQGHGARAGRAPHGRARRQELTPNREDRRRLFSSEALRRDRAVSSRSEQTSVALGDERGEQLSLADAPLRGSAHDLLDHGVERGPEESRAGTRASSRRRPPVPPRTAGSCELRLRADPAAACHRLEPHQVALVASRTAASPASRRARAAPNAADTVTSNTSSSTGTGRTQIRHGSIAHLVRVIVDRVDVGRERFGHISAIGRRPAYLDGGHGDCVPVQDRGLQRVERFAMSSVESIVWLIVIREVSQTLRGETTGTLSSVHAMRRAP